jgi:5-methylcytosine-specific restriction protein A
MSPHMPASPCRTHGCPQLTHDGYCPRHRRERDLATDQRRGTSSARGYGHSHRKRRAFVLRRDPLCVLCLAMDPSRITPSTDADHTIPKCCGGADDTDNMRGLCHSHHSRETAKHMRLHHPRRVATMKK